MIVVPVVVGPEVDVAVAEVVWPLLTAVGGLELEVFALLGFGISQKGMPEKVPY